ncbi:MAG TPA: hypothetical protein VES03_06890 [Motilibacterales bacterium]|nr:hypothetical protein [Motilibacterales bacterium]
MTRGGSHPGGSSMFYGSEQDITEELRELNTDRLGRCWLDLVDDEPAQLARWGQIVLRSGPWPARVPRIEAGRWAWEDAREAERRRAWQIEDPIERGERMRDIQARYGPAPRTSTTLGKYPKGEIND